ncbi:MAG: YihY family inner membrane protein [Chromatiales bacterium]|jgi:membrane protein|nr:YihY family inner membrane protein [Chromatiales bacterium]
MKTLTEAIDHALWRRDLSGRPWPERLAWTVARYINAVVRDLLGGQLTLRAMSLVYTTLLSTVPLLALSFSVIKIFGVHNRLQPQLYRLMEPLGPKGVEIIDWVIRAIDNLEGGVLGTISLVFLIYTAIAMVEKVESTFNYVWQVTRPRHLAKRLSEYISVLLIGPVVMTFALGLIASIGAHSVVQTLRAIEPFGSAIVVLGQVLPYVLVIAVFTFLYKFMPNSAVRFGAALTGGVAAGVMWAFVGSVFASVVALSSGHQAIYSTFAVAVSALIWLYLSWLILLVGAQIAFYAQNPLYLRLGQQVPHLANELRERIALNIMYLVGMAFRTGDTACTIESVSDAMGVPGPATAPVLSALEAAGLVRSNDQAGLMPGREMSRITLAEVLAAVRAGGDTGALQPPVWAAPVDRLASDVQAAVERLAAATTLSAFLDQDGVGDKQDGRL